MKNLLKISASSESELYEDGREAPVSFDSKESTILKSDFESSAFWIFPEYLQYKKPLIHLMILPKVIDIKILNLCCPNVS